MTAAESTQATEPARATIQRAFTLVVILAFMLLLREGLGLVGSRPAPILATLALGFLLLSSFVAGRILNGVGLPRITGYILLGLAAGPGVLGLVTERDIAQLRLIDDLAISLIALSAGAELRLSELRERMRAILAIMAIGTVAVFVVVAGAVLLLQNALPFTANLPFIQIAAIALILGSIAVANSPSVAIAIINDTRSAGPVATTILSVTVIKDVVVIVLFAIALSVARTLVAEGVGFDITFFFDIGREIGGSILAGAIIGWLISVYLRRVGTNIVLFTFAVAFINATLARELHLEILLVSLTAGFFLENISPVEADPFVDGVHRNSLPLYALFFALAGASIHIGELRELWMFALLFVGLRAAAIFGGTVAGARLAGAEPEVQRYAWLGFISQAGVTLGMVVIAGRAFPEWGAELRTLFVSMVAIHELIGPVAMQYGLRRAGEMGRR